MNDIYIEEDKSVLDAINLLDQNARKILFVHQNHKLLATVTDGDIRRWILKKGDLQRSVKYVANYHPKFLCEEQEALAIRTMKEHGIDAIPIVDKNHVIKKVVFINDSVQEHGMFKKKIPVVIMAGGFGARLSPYTNILPKPLIPIGDYPIVEHIINRFCLYGCNHFYMIVNYKRNMIKAYFNDIDKEYQLEFVAEQKTLGTGGGLSLLQGKIKDTFILTNCDILIDEDLSKAYKLHEESKNLITMVCAGGDFEVRYGVVNVEDGGALKSIQEKPNMTFLVNTGCYFVEPEVIERMEQNKPVDFPSVIQKYMEEGKKIGVYPVSEDSWLDMGQINELEKMKARLGG